MSVPTETLSRRQELETLFRKYPDVPREVIVQEDTLRLGISYSEAALQAAESGNTITKSYFQFTWDRVTQDQLKQGEHYRAPHVVWISGGMYGLRGQSGVRSTLNPESPYMVDVVDGKLTLCLREPGGQVPLADVEYPVIPHWYHQTFPDGTRYGEAIPIDPILNAVNVYGACQQWVRDEQCKFCDINVNLKVRKALGKLKMGTKAFPDVERVATVAEAIVKGTRVPGDHATRSICLAGGTILGKVDHLHEDEFYLRYVEAIRAKIGNRWPVHVQTIAKSKQDAQRMVDAGVTALESNLEVWDKNLFEAICPGKARIIGWDNWVRLLIEMVDVFGEGNVSTNLIKGLEMAQPYGFKDIESAVKSSAEGYDFLMSHGVGVRNVGWYVEPGSVLAGNEPPPLEIYVRLDLVWYETWAKYRMPPVRRFDVMGPGLYIDNGHAFAAMCQPPPRPFE